jgi:uncharacterized protein YndB with AHSA1/START domain
MADSTNIELTINRLFSAPREQVFKAWTDPTLVAKWWGPHGVTNPTCEVDARPGGKINIVMLAGEELGELKGAEWPMEGVFQEVTPPEKLVYSSSAIMDGKPILQTINTVTFEEAGNNQTMMTLHVVVTEATAEAEAPLAGMNMGWSQSVDKLAVLLGGVE